jgi:hypothetical protein
MTAVIESDPEVYIAAPVGYFVLQPFDFSIAAQPDRGSSLSLFIRSPIVPAIRTHAEIPA